MTMNATEPTRPRWFDSTDVPIEELMAAVRAGDRDFLVQAYVRHVESRRGRTCLMCGGRIQTRNRTEICQRCHNLAEKYDAERVCKYCDARFFARGKRYRTRCPVCAALSMDLCADCGNAFPKANRLNMQKALCLCDSCFASHSLDQLRERRGKQKEKSKRESLFKEDIP